MNQLPEQSNQERLTVFKFIISACQHLFSKNKLQTDKMKETLKDFYPVSQNDPLFAAKLAAWGASDKNESRDLQLVSTYINGLNDGDGTPFVEGGTLLKPCYRLVSVALLGAFNPKELARFAYFRRLKWSMNGEPEATHWPRILRTGVSDYLKTLPVSVIEKHVKKGFRDHLVHCYQLARCAPSLEQAQALSWDQKQGGKVSKKRFVNPFKGMSDKKIAETIKSESMSFRYAVSLLPETPSLEIMESLLSVATPNELVVQTTMFEKSGLLADKDLSELFYSKVARARNVDRVDTIKATMQEEVKEKIAESRTTARRQQFGKLDGTLWLDIDISYSMHGAIEVAKECASILCDVVGADNFEWGAFNTKGTVFTEKPTSKEKAMQILYPVSVGGYTNCFANYKPVMAVRPVKYWIWVTDGGHNYGTYDISDVPKPEVAIIVYIGSHATNLETMLRNNGIEPVFLKPESLKSSNLVVQAIKTAIAGEIAVIEEIMSTPLPIEV